MGETDDLIIAVISEINVMANMTNLVIDFGVIRDIYINKKDFMSYTQVEKREDIVYLGDSKTTEVLGKGIIFSNSHLVKIWH